MSGERISYKDYIIKDVTKYHHLWSNSDPVRPNLTPYFKASKGRKVYGLMSPSKDFVAFICIARVSEVPYDERTLDLYSSYDGRIAIPYSVWSLKPGAGKFIVNKIIKDFFSKQTIDRTVTLSPLTKVARNFHLKNNAIELRMNKDSVNFEYRREDIL